MKPRNKISLARKIVLPAVMTGVASALLFFSAGCEDDHDDAKDHYAANDVSNTQRQTVFADGDGDGVAPGGETQDLSFTSDPPDLEVSSDGGILVLSASGGAAPYSWSVRYPARGSVDSSGASVVYTRNTAGDNVVELSDAQGTTRQIHIRQP